MSARLLLDEMYPGALAELLRAQGHDAIGVVESVDLLSCDDPTVLGAAADAARCLVTENVRDFAVLVRDAGHAGVLLVNARRWPRSRGGIARLAVALHEMISAGLLPGKEEVGWLQ